MVTLVDVLFMDMGAAAPLKAIRITKHGRDYAIVDTSCPETEAYAALAEILNDPPGFPWFVELRAARMQADTA